GTDEAVFSQAVRREIARVEAEIAAQIYGLVEKGTPLAVHMGRMQHALDAGDWEAVTRLEPKFLEILLKNERDSIDPQGYQWFKALTKQIGRLLKEGAVDSESARVSLSAWRAEALAYLYNL